MKGFIVKKLGMTQKFSENGKLEAATICQAAPCYVVGKKLEKRDGYRAVQLAAGKKKRANKPLKGQLRKAKLDFVPAVIKEVPWNKSQKTLPKLGEKVSVDQVLEPGAEIDVIGKSKGRGFTGVVKRWGFRTQPRSHGQKQRWRAPGSIGAQTPGRVIKGKKMPGHYGNEQVTVKNLEVLAVDSKKDQVIIKGAVPGHKNGWLVVIPRNGKKQENEN